MPTKKNETDAVAPEEPMPQRPPDDLPPPDLPPPGDGDPPGPIVRIFSVSPIAGALAGGITITLTGRGFQPEAEVFFGSSQSPSVTFDSSATVRAVLPAATETGSVSVSLVNPDGTSAIRPGGFTYVVTGTGAQAEVIGVTPLSVIEDTETEIIIRGRNLIEAQTNGMLALRGPGRVQVTSAVVTSSRDDATGIESLTFTVRITATPPLEQHERMAIQILASSRPGSQNDGIPESSRKMFTVLPRAVPVPIAFTDNLEPGKPNLVVVAGRNLQGCTLSVGEGATLHVQRSDEQTLVGIVTVSDSLASDGIASDGSNTPVSTQLSIRSDTGGEVAQFAMSVGPSSDVGKESPTMSAMSAQPGEGAPGIAAEPGAGDIGLTLTPIPGQQMLGPTAEDSTIFNLGGESLSNFFFDFGDFEIVIFERTFIISLFNEVRLIPFFDNGIGDALDNTPVLAQVGKLFRLRGVGLLVALRVELVIHIEIVLIIGFRFNIWPFGLFNEFFGDYPFGIGSIVVTVRLVILVQINFLISFLVALVKPGGALKVLFFFRLTIDIDFTISTDGRTFHFDPDFDMDVDYTRIGPLANQLRPCGGRFQLADDNGQTVFTNSFGDQQSYYFVHSPGECCVPWEFNMRLVRFRPGGGLRETVQEGFRADFCLNAAPSPNQLDVVVVSNRTPNGFPPPLELDVLDTASVRALARPVDETGHPIPGAGLRDVTELGFQVEFYLLSPPEVLSPGALRQGTAIAQAEGQNTIEARLFKSDVVIRDPDTGEELPSALWPGSIRGFDILGFLARGLPPAARTGALPVIVHPPTSEIRVEPTLAYRVNPNDPLTECPQALNAPAGMLEIERYEPFEAQREFVLAIKVNVGGLVTTAQTLNFTVRTVQMTPSGPLAGTGIGGNRQSENRIKAFFSKVVEVSQHVSVEVRQGDTLVELKQGTTTFAIVPNNVEADVPSGQVPKLVPPGFNFTNRHVVLSVELEVQSSANVIMNKRKLDMAVRNDETYEEYLRVTKDVVTILGGSGAANFGTQFSGFGLRFLNALTGGGHGSDLIKTHGEQLWKAAYEMVQRATNPIKDDRPLYWARLQGIGALRAYSKRKATPLPPQQLQQAIDQFEWTSRGLDLNGRIVFEGVPATTRKVVVTGFDPFGLPSLINRSNPSGLIALEFNMKSVGSSQPPVHIRTAIFPVRYREFDAGWVEKAFEVTLGTLILLVTTSENSGRDFYDVERWAGKNRLNSTDNNNMRATGTPVSTGTPPTASLLLNPPGTATAAGDEFLETTLPYKQVITSAPATRTLKGPHRDQTPFVIDQSYKVIATTASVLTPGEFRPEPNETDPAGFTEQPDRPDSSKKANLGSGDNYLSNEIFYRTALVRNTNRPTLASGHLHVPGTDTTPQTSGLKLVEGVGVALGKFVDALASLQPRITNFSPPAGRPGDTVTIIGERFDGAGAVLIGTTSLDTFTVDDSMQITAEVSFTARSGRISVVTAYGTAVSAEVFGVIRRPPREVLAAQLTERRLALGLQPRDAAQQLGVTSRTYTRWERAQDEPRTRYLPAITRFLGHDPSGEPETLGERIRAAREREGLSKPQLAQRLGISASTVHAWEADTVSRPTPRITRIFEDYLNEV
jgi:transcriptional regulator with XRE-family HTH domain/pyrrolidone-carboxylate peptidase